MTKKSTSAQRRSSRTAQQRDAAAVTSPVVASLEQKLREDMETIEALWAKREMV